MKQKDTPLHLRLGLFPAGVFDPRPNVCAVLAEGVLEAFSLAAAVLEELALVDDALLGDSQEALGAVLGLTKDLLRRDLHRGRRLVLDPRSPRGLPSIVHITYVVVLVMYLRTLGLSKENVNFSQISDLIY